ncbi:hypothetical protein CR513_32806, partial [Mucuna pruriens]
MSGLLNSLTVNPIQLNSMIERVWPTLFSVFWSTPFIFSLFYFCCSFFIFIVTRTLKELATPDVVYQPWCIQYPQLEPTQKYELKSGLIHLLPKFHGLVGEDPHKHLKEFHVVCSTIRPQWIPEDYIKMKAFPFSLDGAAKDWLYLQPALFNTWGDMKRTFLEKFFPASRTATIRKEICGIREHTGETLHEYWE